MSVDIQLRDIKLLSDDLMKVMYTDINKVIDTLPKNIHNVNDFKVLKTQLEILNCLIDKLNMVVSINTLSNHLISDKGQKTEDLQSPFI